MEILLGIAVFLASFLVLYVSSKNSFRSRLIQDYNKNMNLAKQALEKGDFETHASHKRKANEFYEMIRRCDCTDTNIHWR